MLIIPAIDLKDGQCVRLRQGRMDDATVFSSDPVAMARQWVTAGCRQLHLVDLNGAFAGQPVNGDIIKAIATAYPDLSIQIGGGIRSAEVIESYLSAGVQFVIIGTQAVRDPDFVRTMCKDFAGHIMVGLDARDGLVAIEGWSQATNVSAVALACQFRDVGVSAIVYTDIALDGMLQGVNLEATRQLANQAKMPVIASGGVTDMRDIKALAAIADGTIWGVITGRAIYEGTLDLAAAQRYCDGL